MATGLPWYGDCFAAMGAALCATDYAPAPFEAVMKKLDVALGEYPAPGGDGVYLLVLQGQFVQFADGHVHQGGHLVDEGPG